MILFCFSEISRARALPKESALAPPPCIWRMKKIHTPMKSSIGTHCRKIMYQGFWSGGFTLMRTPAVPERLDEVRVVDDVGPELAAVLELAGDEVAADRDGLDPALLDVLQELGEVRLGWLVLRQRPEHGEQEDDDEADHHPEGEVLVERDSSPVRHPPPGHPGPRDDANLRNVSAV